MRLIDADALERVLCERFGGIFCAASVGDILDVVDEAPAVCEPPVRCGECCHMEGNGMVCVCGLGHMGVVQPEYFCSYGERVTE